MPWNIRILLVGLALLVVGVLGTGIQQYIDPTFLPSLPDTIIASITPQLSENEYTEKYQQAEVALNKSDWVSAERLLNSLKFQNNSLQPVVLLQLAKSEAQQGKEGTAEYNLQLLANRYRLTTFKPLAQYQLAQSYLRSSQLSKAKSLFDRIVDEYPKSQLALGSQYYLGEIAEINNDHKHAIEYWRTYIEKSQDGRFSDLAADGLRKLKANLSANDHGLLAKIAIANSKWELAQSELKNVTAQNSWLLNAQVHVGLNKIDNAVRQIQTGLVYAKDKDEADNAIDIITKRSTNVSAILKSLLSQQNLNYGRDTILWELSQRSANDKEKQQYQSELLKNYPNSNWAPETAWSQIFNSIKAGKTDAAITQANQYIQRYPYSRSAPKVLFWQAKLLQRQKQFLKSNELFKTLITQYPETYFAFRAKQIISNQGFPRRLSSNFSINDIKIFSDVSPDDDELTPYFPLDNTAKAALIGLLKAKATVTADNLLEQLSDIENKKPHPYIQALIKSSGGDYYSAIKLIDKHVKESFKLGKQGNGAQVITEMPSHIQKVWYPFPFTESQFKWSQQRGLPAFLTASIIRQESAYNPLAISSSKALGLMQLLPSTAAEVAKTDGLNGFSPQELFLTDTNIRLGTRYLQYLQQRFSGATIFTVGAYNGGPNAMAKWVAQGKATNSSTDLDWFIETIPYEQTREYIQQVYGHYYNYQRIYAVDK